MKNERSIYQNYSVLASAILNQAYKDALYVNKYIDSNDFNKRNKAERLKKEIELFINSTWFEDLVMLMKEGD